MTSERELVQMSPPLATQSSNSLQIGNVFIFKMLVVAPLDRTELRLDVSIENGRIDVSIENGRIDVSIKNGRIDVSIKNGRIDVSIENGRIDVSIKNGRIDVSIENGRIEGVGDGIE